LDGEIEIADDAGREIYWLKRVTNMDANVRGKRAFLQQHGVMKSDVFGTVIPDLLAIFKEDFPRQLLALREAVEAKDGDRVATAAHTLRGMLSNLAATQAAATAARLEQMGRKNETLGFQEAFGVFQNDANKLLPQLDTCMAEVCK
jgi:HPt (histidine-containing phosphotransfer) domain-containing protein